MRIYRQPQTQTILYEQFIADSAVRAEYERYAKLVCELIGYTKYGEWCDAFLPDGMSLIERLRLVKAFYNGLTQEHLIKQGEARQDWIDMKNEDAHL